VSDERLMKHFAVGEVGGREAERSERCVGWEVGPQPTETRPHLPAGAERSPNRFHFKRNITARVAIHKDGAPHPYLLPAKPGRRSRRFPCLPVRYAERTLRTDDHSAISNPEGEMKPGGLRTKPVAAKKVPASPYSAKPC